MRNPMRFADPKRWSAFLARERKKLLLRAINLLPRLFADQAANDPFHAQFSGFVARVNRIPQARILELGSRNVSGNVRRQLFTAPGEYVGFDIHPGPNVDVVGDAHRLSELVPRDHFEVVFCISVFEHLAMPWKVALEINRVLRVGGLVFVATHPTWPTHELPWDFWRFGAESFKALFNPGTGFELERAQEGLPCSIIPHGSADPEVARQPANLGVAMTARKIGQPDPGLRWDVSPESILSSHYPPPKG